MARSRNIKPGFCRNEDLAECSIAARLCFALLPMVADREGRLEDRPRRIKGEIFPFDAVEVGPLLTELDAHGLIARYVVDGLCLIQILGFRKHQNPHHREIESKLPPHPSLRLDADGKYIKPEASPGLHDAKAEALPCSHEVKALGKPEAEPEASPGLWGHETTMHGGKTLLIPQSLLIPDSLIPDSGEEKHAAHAPARPLAEAASLALVERSPVERSPPDDLPDCPHREVLALWAEVLPAMPRHLPNQWKGTRAEHLRARWREAATEKRWPDKAHGLTYLRKLFAYIGQSAFLTGHVPARDPGKRPFVIELEWLVNPTNWAKVIEGKYHQEAA